MDTSRNVLAAQRWTWPTTVILLLMSAVAAARSTYLHWLPCQGAMLEGTVLRGYRYSDSGFSAACLRQMDQGGPAIYFPPDPAADTATAIRLAAVAIALAGLAWVAMVAGMRCRRTLRGVGAAAALPTLCLAVLTWSTPDWPAAHEGWTLALTAAVELAVLAACGLITRFVPATRGWSGLRLMLVAWSCSAFGLFHLIGEYLIMMSYSDANWDTPPGTGYLAVLVLAGGAVSTMLITLCPEPGRLIRQIRARRPTLLQNVSEGV